MLRGFTRYEDVFAEQWDNFFCLIYDPPAYPVGYGFGKCPKNEEEREASDESLEDVSPLPPVPEHQL
jgi:hypothetical protein